MIVKDSMILIHLAKITLLEKSCDYFNKVMISKKVFEEILFNKNKGYEDIFIIEKLVKTNKIKIKETKNKELLKKIYEYNIYKGEAESIALYIEENADYLATDDDNVRKKSEIFGLTIIGTPVIILKLYQKKIINKEKFIDSISKLRKIGWFTNAVLDKILMEAEK